MLDTIYVHYLPSPVMTQIVAAEMPGADAPTVRLTAAAQARLEEVMRLMNLDAPERALEVALEELAERQRFLALVDAHERGDRP